MQNQIPLVLVRVAVFWSCRRMWRMLLMPTSPARVRYDLCIHATWQGWTYEMSAVFEGGN
jgi:hypothetical protein